VEIWDWNSSFLHSKGNMASKDNLKDNISKASNGRQGSMMDSRLAS